MHKLVRITTVPMSLLILLRSQLKFMSDYYEVVAISSKGAGLEKVSQQTGLRTVGINMTREITPFKDLKALWSLYSFLKKEKPTIVHTHTPKAGILGMIAARMAGVPLRLHTVAGMPLLIKSGVMRSILEVVEKITYSCATNVYPNSFLMKQIIVDNKFCRPEKLKVIGNGSSNGVDVNYFNPNFLGCSTAKDKLRKEYSFSQNDIVFCFIGRIVADKGIRELIEAFEMLLETSENVKLLLLGPFENHLNPLNEWTEKQIFENQNIVWVDFKADVRPFFVMSDIFVFPSYREGFPNVVMQAGAMGLPSIVSDINGCNEIIENGKNGLVIPVRNAYALHVAMRELLDDPGKRQEMAQCSRAIIVEKYDEGFVQRALLNEYDLLCEGRLQVVQTKVVKTSI